MKTLFEQVTTIFDIIKEVGEVDPGAAEILTRGMTLSINTLQQAAQNNGEVPTDMSEQIQMVTSTLGFNLEEIVRHIIRTTPADGGQSGDGVCSTCGKPNCGGGNTSISNKAADEETLNFIFNNSEDVADTKTNGVTEQVDAIIELDKEAVTVIQPAVDDYEKFLAESRVKENLADLSKEINQLLK